MGLIAIACGLIVALGALGASIGIAMVGSKYLESSARQPGADRSSANLTVLDPSV